MKNRNILIIAGGCGIEPVRPVIYSILKNSNNFGKIQLFYGSRSPKDIIFEPDTKKWRKDIDVHLTVDKRVSCKWKENVGVITTLFGKTKMIENPIVIMCGPSIMYKFVIQELKKLRIENNEIYISLERNMDCGIGICQHCAVGPYYVCKDGPVFNLDRIKDYLDNF